ncbi:hypothetical protein C7C46_12345 [Streptomyces tateyamensis]|uniref:Uncharacterized protein n=1 Tax=Streptomyces tateyamensis TaxID=565073 RepID=A0A2V4NEZ4_9ACTN|nr:hypothetical protein [Streptomyces tateyamensis]PYC80489.1 hypothetical protein C7C46_12345 [Streptomyces tateyamensis]
MTLIPTAIALTSAVTLGYAALCAASPFGNCRKCRGFGYAVRTDRNGRPKRGRTCRRCRGIGKRIRIGRHLYNLAHRTWRAGTR